MAKILSKSGEQQLVMVNYACGLNQSETGKYFEWIKELRINLGESNQLKLFLFLFQVYGDKFLY